MIWSIAFCATCSILFCLYASRAQKRWSITHPGGL